MVLVSCLRSTTTQPRSWTATASTFDVFLFCKAGLTARHASSSSSTRWQSRQLKDPFARDAKVQGLKSRAAFKLLQINDKHRLFKRNDTVVDLGFAPGSWSQVAANRTAPRGRVIGVDLIPAQPPRGVSTIQGDFLSPMIQAEVSAYVQDPERGRPRKKTVFLSSDSDANEDVLDDEGGPEENVDWEASTVNEPSYVDMERATSADSDALEAVSQNAMGAEDREKMSRKKRDEAKGRVVDVVLSDMSEPWDQTTGFGKRSISDPYFRMMNTSGVGFRDHVRSMDLCTAALSFGYDTLRTGGHFVCKYYQGNEEKLLEAKLRRMFQKVHRDKPDASRKESREGFFVALRRKEAPTKQEVFAE